MATFIRCDICKKESEVSKPVKIMLMDDDLEIALDYCPVCYSSLMSSVGRKAKPITNTVPMIQQSVNAVPQIQNNFGIKDVHTRSGQEVPNIVQNGQFVSGRAGDKTANPGLRIAGASIEEHDSSKYNKITLAGDREGRAGGPSDLIQSFISRGGSKIPSEPGSEEEHVPYMVAGNAAAKAYTI